MSDSFLISIGSLSGLLSLSELLSLLCCFLTLAVKMLRSLKISFSLAFGAVSTNDSPLLRNFCVLASSIVDNVQFGTGQTVGIVELFVLQNALFVLLGCFCKLC